MIWYLLLNTAVFMLYGIDKGRAVRDDWRIAEKTLLLAAVFGCYGALAGMILFHHKTRKLKFRLLLPLICLAETILYVYLKQTIS